jgi:hypothetical protein
MKNYFFKEYFSQLMCGAELTEIERIIKMLDASANRAKDYMRRDILRRYANTARAAHIVAEYCDRTNTLYHETKAGYCLDIIQDGKIYFYSIAKITDFCLNNLLEMPLEF